MLWLWIDEKVKYWFLEVFWIHYSPHSLGRFRKYFSRCRTSLTIATILKVPRSSRCNVTTGIWKWVICPQYVPNKMGQNGSKLYQFRYLMLNSMTEIYQAWWAPLCVIIDVLQSFLPTNLQPFAWCRVVTSEFEGSKIQPFDHGPFKVLSEVMSLGLAPTFLRIDMDRGILHYEAFQSYKAVAQSNHKFFLFVHQPHRHYRFIMIHQL